MAIFVENAELGLLEPGEGWAQLVQLARDDLTADIGYLGVLVAGAAEKDSLQIDVSTFDTASQPPMTRDERVEFVEAYTSGRWLFGSVVSSEKHEVTS